MHAKDLIRASLDMGMSSVLRLAEDMKDAPLTSPTPKGGNHPMWIVGHLAYSEGSILQEMMLGKTNPLAEWKAVFADGTEPVADAATYPPFDEVLAKLADVHRANLELFESMSEDDLEKSAASCPPDYQQVFGTYGLCFQMVGMHLWMHYGQLADARRAAGRKRLSS